LNWSVTIELADLRAERAANPAVLVAEQQRMALDEREALLLQEAVGALLQVQPVERRLAVEHVERRRRALHVQPDDVLRARGERRALAVVAAEQRTQRQCADRRRRALQEAAASSEHAQEVGVHRRVTNSSRARTTDASTLHAA
jgi:hypothetical protein